MSRTIGAFIAISIAFSAHGAQAASISETRLQGLLSSTAREAVTLETLRARDREVLQRLAGSLADRYADLLVGSELVFSRVVEDGSIFYRLDFVNLRNRDRARALCEILEVNRCIARIGQDRMVVLDVKGDNSVTAVTRIEEDVEEDAFELAMQEKAPRANPYAREVEAKVRDMLDPLGAFPEARPVDTERESGDNASMSGPDEAEVEEPGAATSQGRPAPVDDSKTSPPSLVRPKVRPQGLTEKSENAKDQPALTEDALPVDAGVEPEAEETGADTALEKGAEILQPHPRVAALETLRPRGSFAALAGNSMTSPRIDGADLIPSSGSLAIGPKKGVPTNRNTSRPDMIAVPGLGRVDMATALSAPRISRGKSTFPQRIQPAIPDEEMVDIAQAHRDDATPEAASLKEEIATTTPDRERVAHRNPEVTPMVREVAMKEMESRVVRADIPAPKDRDVALADFTHDAVERHAKAPRLPADPEVPTAIAPSAGSRPHDPVEVAQVESVQAEPAQSVSSPSREPEVAPAAVTQLAQTSDTMPEIEKRPRRMKDPDPERVARVMSDISAGKRLGRVVFDDIYARPARVDFDQKTIPGDLQKLPVKRSNVMVGRVFDAPFGEVSGYGGAPAASLRASGPFEVAQIPTQTPESNEDRMRDAREKTTGALDKLLAREDRPKVERKAEESSDAPSDDAIFEPMDGVPARPGLDPLQSAQDTVTEEVGADDPVAEEVEAASDSMPISENDTRTAAPASIPDQESAPDGTSKTSTQDSTEENRAQALMILDEIARQRDVEIAAGEMAGQGRDPEENEAFSFEFEDEAEPETKTRRAANPQRNGLIERTYGPGAAPRIAPEDLRIELSYVGSREGVASRVEELKAFFPPALLMKGRFFGAALEEGPDSFVVGIAADDIQSRDDLIWYLEQMDMPWAIRAAVD